MAPGIEPFGTDGVGTTAEHFVASAEAFLRRLRVGELAWIRRLVTDVVLDRIAQEDAVRSERTW